MRRLYGTEELGVTRSALAGAVRLDGLWMTLPPTASGGRPTACRRRLPAECVVSVGGLPCTDGTRTLADVASTLPDAIGSRRWSRRCGGGSPLSRWCGATERCWSAGPPTPRPPRACWRRSWCSWPAPFPACPTRCASSGIEAARARLDLAWPALGLFVELDGQHHKDQPVYDARRETAVVAATGWLCGRLTWAEVVHTPNSTARRLAALAEQARRRPVSS
jgi:hypothetical protein